MFTSIARQEYFFGIKGNQNLNRLGHLNYKSAISQSRRTLVKLSNKLIGALRIYKFACHFVLFS